MWKKTELFLTLMVLAVLVFWANAVPSAESDRSVRFGRLTVGNDDENERSLDGSVGTSEPGYQADEAAAATPAEHRQAKLRLQRLNPSVECDADSMTLRLRGNTLPDFLVERGEESSVPLSQMPENCGFSVKRARRDVLVVAKYDGCHVGKQGEHYVLPLHAWGAPLKMSCPVSSTLQLSCLPSAMVINVCTSTDDLKVMVGGQMQPLVEALKACNFTLETASSGWAVRAPYSSSCLTAKGGEWLLSVQYINKEQTLSCPGIPAQSSPVVSPVTQAPPALQDPVDYPYPYPYFAMPRPWLFPHGMPGAHIKVPTNAPTTTPPPTTTTTTTAATTTTTAPPLQEPVKLPPFLYGYGMPWPWNFQHGYPPQIYMSPMVAPTTTTTAPTTTTTAPTTTTTAPTTTTASADEFWHPLPWVPEMYGGFSGVKQPYQMSRFYPFSYPLTSLTGSLPVGAASVGPKWPVFSPQMLAFDIKSPPLAAQPSQQGIFPFPYNAPQPYNLLSWQPGSAFLPQPASDAKGQWQFGHYSPLQVKSV